MIYESFYGTVYLWERSIIGVPPHHYQANKSKYSKTKKLTSSCENFQFFCFGMIKILKLMDVWF
ncbi:hypothetical protein COJ41_28250 [Bacillus thuringiensis]|nr:hypothetical protein COJ41_28250 [Bacillus thuringiensis]